MTTAPFSKRICFALVILAAAALPVLSGCGGKDEPPQHKSIKGRVTSIDVASGQVQMLWYNEKEKQERPITGTLAADAEILINGRTARLEDVMIDDTVEVTGRREKEDGQPKLVAVKVTVTRTTTEPADSPASQPKP